MNLSLPLAFDRVEVPTSRDDLIAYLNGLFEPPPASADGQAADCDEPMIDDTFETLPLPLQLHLAALALENARTAVSKGN